MSLVLYHYVHCPFCIRVRMALGLLNIPYESRVLAYDDEATPLSLSGKKMLPLISRDGMVMNESLDIIASLDIEKKLAVSDVTTSMEYPQFEKLLSELGNYVHSLAMPYWIWTPEFTPAAREYFQKKKEVKRGPFSELYRRRHEFISELMPKLEDLVSKISPFYQSQKFGLKDILLASHLWGLYVVPEFQFPPELHAYMQRVGKLCSFEYHQDFWR